MTPETQKNSNTLDSVGGEVLLVGMHHVTDFDLSKQKDLFSLFKNTFFLFLKISFPEALKNSTLRNTIKRDLEELMFKRSMKMLMKYLLLFNFNFNGQKMAADVPPRGGQLGEKVSSWRWLGQRCSSEHGVF